MRPLREPTALLRVATLAGLLLSTACLHVTSRGAPFERTRPDPIRVSRVLIIPARPQGGTGEAGASLSRKSFELAAAQLSRRDIPVVDYDATTQAIAAHAGALDTNALSTSLRLAQELKADAVLVPEYGLSSSVSGIAGVNTYRYGATAAFDFYGAPSGTLLGHVRGTGEVSYSNGWGTAIGIAAMVAGSAVSFKFGQDALALSASSGAPNSLSERRARAEIIANQDLSQQALIAGAAGLGIGLATDVVQGAVQGSGAPEKHWTQALEGAVHSALANLLDAVEQDGTGQRSDTAAPTQTEQASVAPTEPPAVAPETKPEPPRVATETKPEHPRAAKEAKPEPARVATETKPEPPRVAKETRPEPEKAAPVAPAVAKEKAAPQVASAPAAPPAAETPKKEKTPRVLVATPDEPPAPSSSSRSKSSHAESAPSDSQENIDVGRYVAVLDQTPSDLDEPLAKALPGLIADEIARHQGRIATVTRKKNAAECTEDASCRRQLAKDLQAQTLAVGAVTRNGKKFELTIRFIDLKSGRQGPTATETMKRIDSLATNVSLCLNRLIEER